MNFSWSVLKCGAIMSFGLRSQRAFNPIRSDLFSPRKVLYGTNQPTNLEAKIQKIELNPSSNTSLTKPGLLFKKRPLRKKRGGIEEQLFSVEGFFNVTGFSTAEEYDLESLVENLKKQNLYSPRKFFSTDNLGVEQDVLYVTAKYKVGNEPRDIFYFRDGSVVLWNFSVTEINNILSFLKPFEREPYVKPLVMGESEIMPYTYIPQMVTDIEGDNVSTDMLEQSFFRDGKFYLTTGGENFLQKYTLSNAIATSIKLGIWEATLDRYIDGMEFLTEDLKKGSRIRISRAQVLRKTGELFALRHVINLSSDLLDTPDFYWDREDLEALYLQVCSYFSISRRTKVMNEKINHCIELAELISSNLNDAHHIRLEWMIIILIMVEVGFEILHYFDRLYGKDRSLEKSDIGVLLATETVTNRDDINSISKRESLI